MTTAIAAYDSDGCRGRCDARCHDATGPDCHCICGGRLHGVGAENAITVNTHDLLAGANVETFAARHGLDAGTLRVEAAGQLALEVA